MQTPPATVYTFGEFALDADARRLSRRGSPVALTPKALDTLLFLIRHRDRPVAKQELYEAVWPDSFVADDGLIQNISAIRRALRDDPSDPKYVATVARVGYRFVATLDEELGQPPSAVATPVQEHLPPVAPVLQPPRGRLGWLLTAAACVAGAVTAIVLVRVLLPRQAALSTPITFEERLPPDTFLLGSAAVSPDGKKLAFAAQDMSGVARIWVRAIDGLAAEAVTGTEDGRDPFWSPDSQSLGFSVNAAIRRVHLPTKSMRTVAELHHSRPRGGSWTRDDRIVFGDLATIFSVPIAGTSEPTPFERQESDGLGELRWPQALDDNEHVLFYASGETAEKTGTYLTRFDAGATPPVQLVRGVRAFYAAPDHLLYVRDGALVAQRFDAVNERLTGMPVTVRSGVPDAAILSSSTNGVLAMSSSTGRSQLLTLDRAGKPAAMSIDLPRLSSDISLSPSGTKALVSSFTNGEWELWLVDLERRVSTKLLDDATYAAWAPDGTRIAYTKITATGADLRTHSMVEPGPSRDENWLSSNELKSVSGWSPDGKSVVFAKWNSREETSQDLWLLPAGGQGKPVALLKSRARENWAAVSPGGRWFAYTSDESGSDEVYVESFPSPGTPIRISPDGGRDPLWRADGSELFYVSTAGKVTAVPVTAGATSFSAGRGQPLFSLEGTTGARQFAATPDGQRFVVLANDPKARNAHVTMISDWKAITKP